VNSARNALGAILPSAYASMTKESQAIDIPPDISWWSEAYPRIMCSNILAVDRARFRNFADCVHLSQSTALSQPDSHNNGWRSNSCLDPEDDSKAYIPLEPSILSNRLSNVQEGIQAGVGPEGALTKKANFERVLIPIVATPGDMKVYDFAQSATNIL
jgi:hypothetical protein